MSIKVSIIVPVYKTEQYLRKCLDSLVKQTLKDIEILVVNDGSPDNSQEIIDEYEKKYSSVKALLKENGGLSDARNYGIACAKGEFITFVDSDDWIEPHTCECMYQYAMEKKLDVVVSDTFMDYPERSYILKANTGYSEDMVKAYIIAYPNAPARLIRSAIMKEHLFKVGTWYEDLQLMPTMAIYTDKIGFVDQPLYHYLQRTESIMNQTVFNEKFNDIFCVLNDVKNAYEKNTKLSEYYSEIEFLFITHLQRGAVLRFAGLDGGTVGLEKVEGIMKTEFPRWSSNKYLKQASWKFRLICLLGKWKQYWIIKILKKIV